MQSNDNRNTSQQKPVLPSYWQKTSPRVTLSDDLPATADVVVVGGGLLGTCTAYWLARKGVDVVLLERSALAYGATGRNGGFVGIGPAEGYPDAIARLGHATARAILRVTQENTALVRQVVPEETLDCDYREPGIVGLALDARQLEDAERLVTALQADGTSAVLLDRTQMQELVATPLGPEVVGGSFLPGCGLVHSARLIQGLMQAAERHGAHAHLATVQRLESYGDDVCVQTTRGKLVAHAAVVAANAWTSEILPELTDLITPVRGQVLAYAPLPRVFHVGMGIRITETEEYWQQTLDGSFVIGGCRTFAPGHDVGIREMQPTAEVQTALEQVFPRVFPSLAGLQVAQRWAGLMAFTPDYVPIADRVPGVPNAWFVGGFSGYGMPFGLRMGQLLAAAATEHDAPAALAPFCMARPTLVPPV